MFMLSWHEMSITASTWGYAKNAFWHSRILSQNWSHKGKSMEFPPVRGIFNVLQLSWIMITKVETWDLPSLATAMRRGYCHVLHWCAEGTWWFGWWKHMDSAWLIWTRYKQTIIIYIYIYILIYIYVYIHDILYMIVCLYICSSV